MIFVTVGTQLPFDRLIKIMDEIPTKEANEIIVQAGNSKYTPSSFQTTSNFSRKEFEEIFHRSDVIVSHAGMGTILTAIKLQKPLVIFPRLRKFNEHRNDHQSATANYMKDLPNIYIANDKEELFQCIEAAKSAQGIEQTKTLNRASFILRLKSFIESA